MITRILIDAKGKYYYQRDGKDVSTHFGMVKAADLAAVPDGGTIKSNLNEVCTVVTPTWLDHYRTMKRGPQIMLLKDLGVIAAETGIGPESIVGDAGTGSGAAACYFARIAKHVHSFDVEAEHKAIGERNAQALGANNITFHHHDIYESIPHAPEGKFDVFLWDNPEPWRALAHIDAIAVGGWIVAYLPSINQTAQFVNAVLEHPGLQHRKTVELIEREWAIKGLKVRPSSAALGHTGFLVFVRRIA